MVEQKCVDLSQQLEVNYNFIKRIVVNLNWTPKSIIKLKCLFSKHINSRREESIIGSMEELLDVLEERCVLDCVKIEELFKIDKEADCERLKMAINTHIKLLRDFTRENRAPNPVSVKEEEHGCNKIPVRIPDSVVTLLSAGIGHYWRDFGRYLNLKEGQLNQIENYRASDRIKLVLSKFEEVAYLLTYKGIILDGLMTIRRNDLKEQVEKIFTQVVD